MIIYLLQESAPHHSLFQPKCPLGHKVQQNVLAQSKFLTQLGTAQVDLDKFVAAHPDSNMAKLVAKGISYPNTHILPPSDSFPGLLSLVTGARLFWRTSVLHARIATGCTRHGVKHLYTA